jgi:hypothetical protein
LVVVVVVVVMGGEGQDELLSEYFKEAREALFLFHPV